MHQLDHSSLTPSAKAVIDAYLALPLGAGPSCPYFNNRRRGTRSNLRVLVGKGTPKDLAEECEIRALQNRIDIKSLGQEQIKSFMISQDLGVDCSGFVYHVLNKESSERGLGGLAGNIHTNRPGFFGSFIARLRPAENIGAATFASNKNSVEIPATEAQAGDIITLLGTGPEKNYNHILVITDTEQVGVETRISYAHSYSWPSDGVHNHGVRTGTICVQGPEILKGSWRELDKTGEENYTRASAASARETSVRRLRAFMK